MNDSRYRLPGKTVHLLATAAIAIAFTVAAGDTARAAGPAPVDLGAAARFVILTKSGISNVPTSAITGNLGVSPIAATAITGFSLVADSTNVFSRSAQVTGKIYAANYAGPTPANLTSAIGAMEAAYTDAAGRSLPDFTELYAGDLSGRTLAPGLYTWSTGVLITTSVTLAGDIDDVWILQIAGDLTLGSGAQVVLSGGAQARNIFWQVGGGAGAEIGTTAHVEGTILAQKAIHLRTGASLNGRAQAQTAVTLAKNHVVIPPLNRTLISTSAPARDGWVRESSGTSNLGGANDAWASTIRVGDDWANRQYVSVLNFDTSGLPNTAVITKVTLMVGRQGAIGTDPLGTHGALLADIRRPYFGRSARLQNDDFQAAAGAAAIATFGDPPAGIWYSATVNATGLSRVNRRGTTQFRLRFTIDDNDNLVSDYVKLYSGNAAAARRPRLIVDYYVPNT